MVLLAGPDWLVNWHVHFLVPFMEKWRIRTNIIDCQGNHVVCDFRETYWWDWLWSYNFVFTLLCLQYYSSLLKLSGIQKEKKLWRKKKVWVRKYISQWLRYKEIIQLSNNQDGKHVRRITIRLVNWVSGAVHCRPLKASHHFNRHSQEQIGKWRGLADHSPLRLDPGALCPPAQTDQE